MTSKTITTGNAARLCSVTRDTILKWIKKGILKAVRTPGGHYRVLEESIRPFMAVHTSIQTLEPVNGKESQTDMIPCWEYMSPDGAVTESCQECLVYRAKALRCFEVAPLGEDSGYRGKFCKTSCQECEYFRTTQGTTNTNNIIVLTEDVYLIASLTKNAHLVPFMLRFTSSTYECSALIEKIKPGIIVVDFELHQVLIENLCQRIAEDPRLPGAKIIGIVPKGMNIETLNLCTHTICASLEKPVSIRDVETCIHTLEGKAAE